MSADRRSRIDRDEAERLLAGGDRAAGADPLAELLAAAAAPARDGELAGEQAALSAFREAWPAPADLSRKAPTKPVMARVLTTKLVLAAATVTALGGGVVAAASTGNLPAVTGGSHGGGPHGGGPHGGGAHGGGSTGRPSRGPSDRSTPAGPTPSTAAAPAPSMFGLCHAYAGDAGRALDNPAFSVLISNAGGRDKVAGYCADVLAGGRTKPAKPVKPVKPARTAKPGNAPTVHPTVGHGRPTAHPDGGHGGQSAHPAVGGGSTGNPAHRPG